MVQCFSQDCLNCLLATPLTPQSTKLNIDRRDFELQGTRRFGSEESEPIDWIVPPKSQSKTGAMTQPGLSEMFAYHATTMANTTSRSLVVFSRKVSLLRLTFDVVLHLCELS